jgi:hypothetical protein
VKALTLTQPWAQLVMMGEKKLETRSWPTAFTGPLAIHAAKGWDAPSRAFATNVLPIALEAIPRGVRMVWCKPITAMLVSALSEKERQYGDYTPGRFAFFFADVVRFPEPIVATGKLGLWDWVAP